MKIIFIWIGVLFTVLVSCIAIYVWGWRTSAGGKYAEFILPDTQFPVERVVDGDTLVVLAGGHDVTIRLIGMDTPEVVDPRKPVQCFGPEASAKAKEIFGYGPVTIEKDPQKGDYEKYGRVLGYVHVPAAENPDFPDGLFYNQYMIEQGFAREYTYFNEPYKYQAEFKVAQKSAKKAKVGLWGACQQVT